MIKRVCDQHQLIKHFLYNSQPPNIIAHVKRVLNCMRNLVIIVRLKIPKFILIR